MTCKLKYVERDLRMVEFCTLSNETAAQIKDEDLWQRYNAAVLYVSSKLCTVVMDSSFFCIFLAVYLIVTHPYQHNNY